jgi:hypothetical protein
MKKQIVLSTSANWLRLSLILCVLLSLAAGRVSAEATGDARQIASAANFHGGLVIHIAPFRDWIPTPASSKRLAPPFANAAFMVPFR